MILMTGMLNVSAFVLLGTLLTACASGCGGNATREPMLWRFAIEESKGSVQHRYAMRFKDLIEARTEGRVKVVVYPYGTLGTSTQLTEQLAMGVIEFAMASPGSLGKFIPELQVFLLHFVLPERPDQLRKVLTDPRLKATFDPLYAAKGLELTALFAEGQMAWTLKQEVRRPADFAGIKMRVMTSPILLAAYGAYGASPTPMPYSEVYSGLQLNMIDGQVNPVFAIERQKFHEVTDWLVFPGHASFITSAATNRSFLTRLPDDLQGIVTDVFAELEPWIFAEQTAIEARRLADILRGKKRQRQTLHLCGDVSGLLAAFSPDDRRDLVDDNEYLVLEPPLSAEELAAFREASTTVREEFLRIGGPAAQDVLEQILELSRECASVVQERLGGTYDPADTPSSAAIADAL
jgi:TRAP-type C4-dicarboxylate transport system substrate-binding protein